MTSCPREQELSRALASATTVPAELRAHAGGCEACLGIWLRTAVHSAATPAPGLDPSALWERAGRMRRLRAEAQMARIVTSAQVAAAVLILAVLVFFGSQPATWSAFSFAGTNTLQLAAGFGLLLLAAVGVSRLIAQDG
jgi:hypothetical protein